MSCGGQWAYRYWEKRSLYCNEAIFCNGFAGSVKATPESTLKSIYESVAYNSTKTI